MKRPESMDELVYFTRRDIGEGEATVWVFRGLCPKCGKGVMGKPVGPKGKIKVRAKEYVCPECGNYRLARQFQRDAAAYDGYSGACRLCRAQKDNPALDICSPRRSWHDDNPRATVLSAKEAVGRCALCFCDLPVRELLWARGQYICQDCFEGKR